jgi:hypothetical protein
MSLKKSGRPWMPLVGWRGVAMRDHRDTLRDGFTSRTMPARREACCPLSFARSKAYDSDTSAYHARRRHQVGKSMVVARIDQERRSSWHGNIG